MGGNNRQWHQMTIWALKVAPKAPGQEIDISSRGLEALLLTSMSPFAARVTICCRV